MSAVGHIFATLGKAIVNILLAFIVSLIVAFAIVVGIETVHRGGFNHMTTFVYIGAALIGILAGYAGAVTALMVAAVREAFAVARGAVSDVERAAGDIGKRL